MKILIVRTFPDIIDPKKYNVQEIGLAKALTRAGHTCGIVLYYGKNEDCIENIPVSCGEDIRDITVYRLHGINILKNGFFPSLKSIVNEYDVIQVHEYDQITSWLYYAFSDKPVVIYHGPYYHPFNKGYNLKCRIFDNTFLKLCKNKNRVCLTKSHAAEHFLRERGFENVTAVGVGLNPDNFNNQEAIETAIPVPEDKFNLLYVGKLEERRNSLLLLDIMEKVCSNQENLNCIIIGDGEDEYKQRFMEKAQSFTDSGRLQYYSSATQMQLREVYKKAQLMLFPTNYDIFGMVLLEAIYFKLPVISMPNGGADMLLHDGIDGWILEDQSVAAWSNKIEEIYLDREKYESVKNTLLQKDNSDLYWDGLVEKFVKGYQKAVAFISE